MSCLDNSIYIPETPCDDCEMTKEGILESLGYTEFETTVDLGNGGVLDRILIGATEVLA